MGHIHGHDAARNPAFHLKYVVDPRPDAAQSLAAELGAQCASLEQVLGEAAVRGVLICSSTDQHLGHALAAVEAGISGAPIQPDFGTRYQQAYQAEIDDFARVVSGEAPPAAGYADGVAALVLADACNASVRSGQPQRVELDGGRSAATRN